MKKGMKMGLGVICMLLSIIAVYIRLALKRNNAEEHEVSVSGEPEIVKEKREKQNKVSVNDVFWDFYVNKALEGVSDKTLKEYKVFMGYLSAGLSNCDIKDITQGDFEDFIENDLLTREFKIPWFKRVMQFYKRLFNYAQESGFCNENPINALDYKKYFPFCHFRFTEETIKRARMK